MSVALEDPSEGSRTISVGSGVDRFSFASMFIRNKIRKPVRYMISRMSLK